MVNIYTASGDGQVHGEADSSKRQQHEARSSMRVDAQDHKDQADAQAAAADVDASSSGSSTAAADSATAAAAAQQHPGSASTGVRAPRPTPLLVGCDTPPRTTGLTSSSSRFSQGHGSGSPQQQPGSAGHASASRPPSGLQNRPAALQIQPPASPLGGGCVTPSGFLSPNAMARPYSGPPVLVDDLDLDVIDGVSNDGGTGGSNSASSSPVVNAVLRSGGLRSSRDHGDLRRTALMNQMLSPRPMMSLSTPSSGPPSLVFTGETRARSTAGW
ncbi:hypothetical protein OEZ86_001102 [Tetradesmus obliquus]|nr:hypothetical protein OEZ86_001102 [Tetradesmus obliquus]